MFRFLVGIRQRSVPEEDTGKAELTVEVGEEGFESRRRNGWQRDRRCRFTG